MFVISILGVLTRLTAYDTQTAKAIFGPKQEMGWN